MELGKQIKNYRIGAGISQEELADKIFVSRQTISNWETNKNYPDINSLILLSTLFNISLDTLVKGDIEEMKETIKQTDIIVFKRMGRILTTLLVITLFSAAPLFVYYETIGFTLWAFIALITLLYSYKVDKFKKDNDVQTIKEIIAFIDGKRLDEINKNREYGKRTYQKIFLAFGSGLITLIVVSVFIMLLN
jgi:transcriptional regulator with XRE-family HTH domain